MSILPKIYSEVMAKLERKLPAHLHYHGPDHTKLVLNNVEMIAKEENVHGKDLELLKIAALYHDTGFILRREDHEKISCEIARRELESLNFDSKDVDIVCNMILATKIPQEPKTKLEMILSDADLEYLGTSEFEEIGDRLYQEILHDQPKLTKNEWNKIQEKFMENHHYHTQFCKKNREPGKLKNLENVRKKIDRNI